MAESLAAGFERAGQYGYTSLVPISPIFQKVFGEIYGLPAGT
jgi:hypothetical protein